jgi:hypothetical protein
MQIQSLQPSDSQGDRINSLESEIREAATRLLTTQQLIGNYRAQILDLTTPIANEPAAAKRTRLENLALIAQLLTAESSNHVAVMTEINQLKNELKDAKAAPRTVKMPTVRRFLSSDEDIEDFVDYFFDEMNNHAIPVNRWLGAFKISFQPEDAAWLRKNCDSLDFQFKSQFEEKVITPFIESKINGNRKERALKSYQSSRQGDLPSKQYVEWFSKQVRRAGTLDSSPEVITTFRAGLSGPLKAALVNHYVTHEQPTSLLEVLKLAVAFDVKEQTVLESPQPRTSMARREINSRDRDPKRVPNSTNARLVGQPIKENFCRACESTDPSKKQIWTRDHWNKFHRKPEQVLLNNITVETPEEDLDLLQDTIEGDLYQEDAP